MQTRVRSRQSVVIRSIVGDNRISIGRRAKRVLTTLALLILTAGLVLAQAQRPTVPAVGQYYSPAQLPPSFHRQYVALGTRLQASQKERISLSGTLTDPSRSVSAQVVIEKGGKLSIVLAGDAKQLIFDGKTAAITSLTSYDSDLLDTFVDDLPETVMAAVAGGNGFRVLGRGFPNPNGAACDLYDVAMPGLTSKLRPYFLKRYCFDTTTALLQYVRHLSEDPKDPINVETRFSNWQQIDNQAIPGTIVRARNNIPVFSFQMQTAVISAAVPDALFGK